MNQYIIRGGHPLFGEITISGAKNAAVGIIPAALLVDGICRIENIPQISDVTLLLNILEELGARIRVLNRHAVELDCHAIRSTHPSYEMARRIRASYYLIGTLLGRFGEATVAMPGGCDFGVRPIDQHIKGFTAMGAEVKVESGFIQASAKDGRLTGTSVYLDVVSVGATMNIMMAAVLATAQGTSIVNENVWNSRFKYIDELKRMGANIQADGHVAVIEGVEHLQGAPVQACDLRAGAAMVIAGLSAEGVTELSQVQFIERGYEDLVDKLRAVGADIRVVDAPDVTEQKEAHIG